MRKNKNTQKTEKSSIVPPALKIKKNIRTFYNAVLRSRSRGAKINLPPGAGAEIKNCGSRSSSFFSY
jgi:hypothetical protein